MFKLKLRLTPLWCELWRKKNSVQSYKFHKIINNTELAFFCYNFHCKIFTKSSTCKNCTEICGNKHIVTMLCCVYNGIFPHILNGNGLRAICYFFQVCAWYSHAIFGSKRLMNCQEFIGADTQHRKLWSWPAVQQAMQIGLDSRRTAAGQDWTCAARKPAWEAGSAWIMGKSKGRQKGNQQQRTLQRSM